MVKAYYWFIFVGVIVLSGCEHPESLKQRNQQVNGIAAAVANKDRPATDLERDKIRKPEQVLAFFDIQKGDTVAELLAAGGYYTELLSHCVGETGKVYMQNNRQFYEFQTDKSVNQRLKDNRLANVVRWDRELTDLQLPKQSLDKLLMILVLHDFYWMEKDVSLVIDEVFQSLKPGGMLGIIDHAAMQGSGAQAAMEMDGIHRIDKQFVVDSFQKRGFVLDAESDVLANANDDRSQAFFSDSLRDKATDRFMLRFVKPEPVVQ